MATRFEVIATALPLHAQRIAEATFANGGSDRLEYLMTQPAWRGEDAGYLLRCSFCWMPTAEGHDYWSALARGAGR